MQIDYGRHENTADRARQYTITSGRQCVSSQFKHAIRSGANKDQQARLFLWSEDDKYIYLGRRIISRIAERECFQSTASDSITAYDSIINATTNPDFHTRGHKTHGFCSMPYAICQYYQFSIEDDKVVRRDETLVMHTDRQ